MNKCVSKSTHPFWESCIGSKIILELIRPPDSLLKCLIVVVASISRPTVYKVTTVFSDGDVHVSYCKKREALSVVKHGWMDCYRDRTKVVFSPHIGVDLSKFRIQEEPDSASSSGINSPFTSPRVSPRSDTSETSSPRSWMSKRLSLQLQIERPRGSNDVASPKVQELRKSLFQRSPRSPRSHTNSREVSPRSTDTSPRSPKVSPK